ncbi:MAG: hypothetical protein ACTSVA_09270 [Candidatus Njordarchaeales archaeon]
MDIKSLQQTLKSLAISVSSKPIIFRIDELSNNDYAYIKDMIESARSLALDLLSEENPSEVLAEAFIQTLIIANILGIDLEKSLKGVLEKIFESVMECN